MAKYIPLDAVLAEIRRRIKFIEIRLKRNNSYTEDGNIAWKRDKALYDAHNFLLSFLDTLEVKEMNNWHLQEKEDIYDAVKCWSLYTFACIMKDGTIQKFTGILDEDCEGHVNIHLDCVDDEYEWEYDDIIYWIEVPNIKAQKGE